mmetsp:Transcript_637/g.1340  ORF Transcript_637/g.1340 Transcript_637/m.1340 type:complete len:268 (-) Transcript_637:479-1282(-)
MRSRRCRSRLLLVAVAVPKASSATWGHNIANPFSISDARAVGEVLVSAASLPSSSTVTPNKNATSTFDERLEVLGLLMLPLVLVSLSRSPEDCDGLSLSGLSSGFSSSSSVVLSSFPSSRFSLLVCCISSSVSSSSSSFLLLSASTSSPLEAGCCFDASLLPLLSFFFLLFFIFCFCFFFFLFFFFILDLSVSLLFFLLPLFFLSFLSEDVVPLDLLEPIAFTTPFLLRVTLSLRSNRLIASANLFFILELFSSADRDRRTLVRSRL